MEGSEINHLGNHNGKGKPKKAQGPSSYRTPDAAETWRAHLEEIARASKADAVERVGDITEDTEEQVTELLAVEGETRKGSGALPLPDEVTTPKAAASRPEEKPVEAVRGTIQNLGSLIKLFGSPDTHEAAKAIFRELLEFTQLLRKMKNEAAVAPDPGEVQQRRLNAVSEFTTKFKPVAKPKVYDLIREFGRVYESEYERISREMFLAINQRKIHTYAEDPKQHAPFQREIVKQVLAEATSVGDLLDFSEEKLLLKLLQNGELGLGIMNIRALLGSDLGKKILDTLKTDPVLVSAIEEKKMVVQGPKMAIDNHGQNLDQPMVGRILRSEMDQKVINVLAQDARKILSKEQVEDLTQGKILPYMVEILAANIDHPEFTADYVNRILLGPEIVKIKGIDTPYYPSNSLGRGGVGEFFRAALLDPVNRKLRFGGLKRANRGRLTEEMFQREAAGAKNVSQAIDKAFLGGNVEAGKNLVNPLVVADNGKTIFYEVVEKANATKDLDTIAADVNTPPDVIYGLIRDSFKGLSILHQAGLVHGDYKGSQVYDGPEGAKLGDFGTVVPFETYLRNGGTNVGIMNISVNRAGERKMVWVGNAPNYINPKSMEGMTPLYYSDTIFNAVKERGPQYVWKIDAYAAGVQLLEYLTGKITMDGMKHSALGGIEKDSENRVVIHLTEARPFGDDRDARIAKVAEQLMDAKNFEYTLAHAVRDLNSILNN